MNKTIKKIAFKLHLWLACISGLIVFIVCITGAIWAVHLNDWIGTSSTNIKTEAKGQKILLPSQLIEYAKDSLQGNLPSSITYNKDEATELRLYNKGTNISMSVDPYRGEILDYRKFSRGGGDSKMSFWDYIRWGHRALWLPWDIGRLVVNYATLTFVLVLITGLILWIPKSAKGLKNRLCLNWRKTTRIKRKVYDLHLILGFYSSLLLIVICFTGMIWGVSWWSSGLYKVTTGKDLPERNVAKSDTTNLRDRDQLKLLTSIDSLFMKTFTENKLAESITINYPDSKNLSSTIGLRISYDKNIRYNYDAQVFDQYSLKEIPQEGFRYGKYSEKGFGEKLRRQNYDIHIGAIWGNFGKVLVFLAALFGASLPVTGYYILFRVKKKKKRLFRKMPS